MATAYSSAKRTLERESLLGKKRKYASAESIME